LDPAISAGHSSKTLPDDALRIVAKGEKEDGVAVALL
jgi:hypothetical protein